LAPSHKNVLQGFILYDVKGKGVKNKITKRRLDMIASNVSSYALCLNGTKQLKQIQEAVAAVTADIVNEKEHQKKKAAQKAKVAKEKKAKECAK